MKIPFPSGALNNSNFQSRGFNNLNFSHDKRSVFIPSSNNLLCIQCEGFYSNAISNSAMHASNGNICPKNLKFSHVNIQGGLKHKKELIESLLEKTEPHVLGLSETNQSSADNIDFNDSMYNFVPGFTYTETYTRVGVLIRKGIRFKVREDIMSKLLLPCVWLDIFIKGKTIAVINCYREHRMMGIENNEPTKTGAAQVDRWSHFVHYWERSLTDREETWLLGDINLDLSVGADSDNRDYYRTKMIELVNSRILSKGVVQVIKGETWLSGDGLTASLIDHIYTDSFNYTSVSNTNNFGADHNTVSVIRRGDEKVLRNQYRRARNMSNFRKDDFLFVLNNLDLDPILVEPSPEVQTQMLTAAIEVAADITCPFVNFKVKKNHTKWMNPDLKKLIEARDAWFVRYKTTNNPNDHAMYRQYRNKVNHEIKKAKKLYYATSINNIKDASEVWSKLDELSGRNSTFSEPINIVKDGVLHDEPQDIANIFNLFYQDKVRKIIDNLPSAPEPQVKGPPPGVKFKFHKVRIKEVIKHIYSLSGSKATGHDGISNVLIKAGIPVIAPVLTRIINNAIRTSSFPETWKVGKIAVIYKNKGEKTAPNNYRPITLLCSLSKVLEKVLFKQILSYFQDNGLMDPRQYGFRPGRSVVHAVLDYLNSVLRGKEEASLNKINALLIDLSAAFDIVSHEVLIRKLRAYGFSQSALTLMESYLTDRLVYTEVENHQSPLAPDLYGVPQGSILGPLLYIIYVVSLKDLDRFGKITYADDVTVMIRANDKEELGLSTNEAMKNLISYFAGSGLKLNNDKTELLTHAGGQAEVVVNEAGDVQQSSSSARLLGITIDSNLNFHKHIDLMLKDIEHRLWLFKKVTKVASTKNRLMYFHGLLSSKFLFGIQCYGGTDPTYLEKVRISYDKCVRVVYGRNPKGLSTAEMRTSLRLLSFPDLLKVMDMGTFRQILHTRVPETLHCHLNERYERQSRQAERSLVRVDLIPRTEKFRRTFLFRATAQWNSLPSDLKIWNITKAKFQDNLKRFLLGDFNGPGPPGPSPPPQI